MIFKRQILNQRPCHSHIYILTKKKNGSKKLGAIIKRAIISSPFPLLPLPFLARTGKSDFWQEAKKFSQFFHDRKRFFPFYPYTPRTVFFPAKGRMGKKKPRMDKIKQAFFFFFYPLYPYIYIYNIYV
jgi:hypothetical protein